MVRVYRWSGYASCLGSGLSAEAEASLAAESIDPPAISSSCDTENFVEPMAPPGLKCLVLGELLSELTLCGTLAAGSIDPPAISSDIETAVQPMVLEPMAPPRILCRIELTVDGTIGG